jgi:hypothetical protein
MTITLVVLLAVALALANASLLVVLLLRFAEERRDIADTLRLQEIQHRRGQQ